MWAFLGGMVLGYAGGFLLGMLTADPNSEWQNRVREIVYQVYEEGRRTAAAEEEQLRWEFQRLTGLSIDEVLSG